MSNREAGVYVLKTQRYNLRGELRMINGDIERTPKGHQKHWDLLRQQEALQHELNRISHRLRQIA